MSMKNNHECFWQQSFDRSIGIPEVDTTNCIPTLNGKGWMTTKHCPYTERWIRYATKCNGRVIDIGCAYGLASLEALKRGARVFANDLSNKHLKALKRLAVGKFQSRLQTRAAAFPYKLHVRPNSIEAALCSRVFHFLMERK